MLRLLWASLRWDDMAAKAPPGGGSTRTGKGIALLSLKMQAKDVAQLQAEVHTYLMHEDMRCVV